MAEIDKNIVRSGEIIMKAHLNKDNMPAKLEWKASDGPHAKFEDCGAFLISVWDRERKEQLQVNLWELEMTMEEMNHFYFQTLINLSNTMERSTRNAEEAEHLREYAKEFGIRNNVLKKKEEKEEK